MVTAKECIKAIEEAIAEFGRYSYYDKGVDSVLDTVPFVRKFKKMDAHEVKKILLEISEHEHGLHFAADMITSMDDMDDEWFGVLMESEILADTY